MFINLFIKDTNFGLVEDNRQLLTLKRNFNKFLKEENDRIFCAIQFYLDSCTDNSIIRFLL